MTKREPNPDDAPYRKPHPSETPPYPPKPQPKLAKKNNRPKPHDQSVNV